MSVQIKKLGAEDLEQARQLLNNWAIDDGETNFRLPDSAHLAKMLSNNTFHAYVALVENEVVGGLTAYELSMFDKEENEIFLFEIGVIGPFRKMGIATRLIEALKATCREKDIRIIFVATSLDNEAAKKLYENTGGELEVVPFYTYNLPK